MRKKIIDEYNISFNEDMNSDQEFNFYCKLLTVTVNGIYIDEVLVKRRVHEISIQSEMGQGSMNFERELLRNRLLTFKDIEVELEDRIKQKYLNQIMTICYSLVGKKVYDIYKVLNLGFQEKGFG